MTLHAPQQRRRSADPHDALTGAPLDPERALLYRARGGGSSDHARRAGYRERSGERVIPAPPRLHTHETEGAVGLAYSLFFGQYLALALDAWRREGVREVSAWWTSDYGIARVARRLRDKFPKVGVAQATLDAVLAVCRDHEDPAAVAERLGQTYDWLGKQARYCVYLAHCPDAQYHRSTFRRDTPPPPEPPVLDETLLRETH